MFSKISILFIRIYQLCISPFLPNHCRFYPSCSHYAKEALEEQNFFYALWLIVARIARCNPWCQGGYDPVPKTRIKN